MSSQKADFLRECMSTPGLMVRPIPIDQFCQAFCVVCSQKDCIRSRANTMIFTERVTNWKDRWFLKVPRASETDENYAHIRAKRFIPIEDGIVFNTTLDHVTASSEESSNPAEKPVEAPVHSIVDESTKPVTEIITPSAPREQPPVVRKEVPTLNNTPFAGGIVLPGKPVDKGTDQFIEPGATFTFEDENNDKD